MLRIVALNEEGSDSEPEEEETATREAQETIAESEYVRAIKLKSTGKPEFALILLKELLETQVLCEISEDNKNDKLWAIRYNCHKNIAIICEEKKQFKEALENYILAMNIDDSDVYTMHRFGQLALRNDALELAEYAFESCLKRNPLHWSAADGILQTLCRNQNILGAYGWALKLYRRDPHYERAVATLQEIASTFKHMIPFYEKFWGPHPEELKEDEGSFIVGERESVFPKPREEPDAEKQREAEERWRRPQVPESIEHLRIRDLSWQTLGQFIVSVYRHLKETEQSMLFAWPQLEHILADSNATNAEIGELLQEFKNELEEKSNHSNSESSDATITQTLQADNSGEVEAVNGVAASSGNAEPNAFMPPGGEQCSTKLPNSVCIIDISNDDSDSNAKSDGNESTTSKPKPRRRSDLHFLEQWGWHKNRRYSGRKKPQQERVAVDSTLNGVLRRMYAKFMSSSYEEEWPFTTASVEQKLPAESEAATRCENCSKNLSPADFQMATQQSFDALTGKLKSSAFDLMLLIYKWLKYISLHADQRLPKELQSLYLEIFDLYMQHFDLINWHQLDERNFEASYRLCLFFLELNYTAHAQITPLWMQVFNHLLFKSGCACDEFRLRLVNLEYLWYSAVHKLQKCVTCLELMRTMIGGSGGNEAQCVLHLPNLQQSCITASYVSHKHVELLREIDLNRVPKLFEAEKWTELVAIISANLQHSKVLPDCEVWRQNFQTQIEIMLQSVWNMHSYEECLLWSEKFLHYTAAQYLKAAKASQCQKTWAQSINFIYSYLEALLLNEGFDIVMHLGEFLDRLVQNTIRLLSYQLDGPLEKNCTAVQELEFKRPWVVLHQIILREENNSPVVVKTKSADSEDDEDLVPNTFLVLFTAHEFLGKRQWCLRDNGVFLHYILDMVTTNLRAPLYDACREAVGEYIEQVTYCLYGYPQKKARSRHLEDHEATPIDLTWLKAMQIFDLYRPENLPEFNSYKLESISADMEQLLLKMLTLMPKELDPTPGTSQITEFIKGTSDKLPEESPCADLPYKINSIFYLLGDYYFKNRDFAKTMKYYTMDLVGNAGRLDSWAGIALSKASKIETKLNSLAQPNLLPLLTECEDTIRCFERCISLNRNQTLLWIEYGSFTYTIHSFCSRHVKHASENMSMEQFSLAEKRKERMLTIAYNCFSLAATLLNNTVEPTEEDGESHEEKWLCQYMLGKISEKRKELPKTYLNYYLTAANYLYESSATYPIKINHSNPTTLSVEALEVFYRTNSAIIKCLEHEKEISRECGDLFNNVLKNLANSPFAFNKAKIDGNSLNAFKRKIADKVEQASKNTKKFCDEQNVTSTSNTIEMVPENNETALMPDKIIADQNINEAQVKTVVDSSNKSATNSEHGVRAGSKTNSNSPSRRESQESAVTGTTTTVTSSTTSSSSSSDTSSSDSDSDSDESEQRKKRENNLPYTETELESIYKVIVRNLEECVTRFSEHYKSIYRLVYHYMNAPGNLCDLNKCEQLLLDQYKTSLGNQINGLFYDRKNNNIFNGIWRIPSSEIDRPGSFAAHLVKCASLLIQLLKKMKNYKLLVDIGLQLYKTPDADKRYISDEDRLELYQQAISCCAQVMRDILKANVDKRNDIETLNLLIDIYRTHKKCIKYMNQKESLFTQLMIDVYKFYIQDKVDHIPDTLNFFDLAIKLCVQEISVRKNLEKSGNTSAEGLMFDYAGFSSQAAAATAPRPTQIPGLTMRGRGRSSLGKTTTTTTTSTSCGPMQGLEVSPFLPNTAIPPVSSNSLLKSNNFLPMMNLFGPTPMLQNESMNFQRLVAEYYKKIMEEGQKDGSLSSSLPLPTTNTLPTTLSLATSLPFETTITPANIPSTATMFLKQEMDKTTQSAVRISNCDITITPSITKPLMTPSQQLQAAAAAANLTLTKLPPSKPETYKTNPDIELIPSQQISTTLTAVTSASSNVNQSNQSIFVKPLANMQSPKAQRSLPADLPNSLTITTVASNHSEPPTFSAVQNKAPPKANKNANKNKQSKPYARAPPMPTALSAAELANLQIPKNIDMDSYNQHAQLLYSYADLLKQFRVDTAPKPTRPAPKRKPKQSNTEMPLPTTSLAAAAASMTPASAAYNAMPKKSQSPAMQAPLLSQSPFNFPMFDANAITMTTLPLASSGGATSLSMSKATFATGATLGQQTFAPQQQQLPVTLPMQVSPTKTLQQKLAERQKANQQNESNKMAAAGERKSSIDVIILD